jgi:RND superfamily putative drug exporter
MFTTLGRFTVRRRRTVLAASMLFFVLSVALGVGVFGQLADGGFDDPSAESTRAAALLDERFDAGSADVVAVLTATSGTVDDATTAAAGLAVTADMAEADGVDDVVSFWSAGRPDGLRSADETRAIALVRFAGAADEPARQAAAEEFLERFDGQDAGPVRVDLGGREAVFAEIGSTIESDLARAETIAIPLTLLLLLVVFGSVVAAGLPVVIGIVSIFGAFLVLYLTSLVTDVSIYSINLVTALGLGLAIDYSLFVVSRFREERRRGRSVDDAVVRTVETAGRTVAFSAVTVAISLSALLVFPLYFLRSFAYAGVGVILVAMMISVISLPALLAVLGPRVDSLRLFRRRSERAAEGAALGDGIWHRIAVGVMRRPFVIAIAAVALLIGLGLPFLSVSFGTADDRVLPPSSDVRATSDILREEFGSADADAFAVVALGSGGGEVALPTATAMATAISQVPGVARVDTVTGRFIDGVAVSGPDGDLAGYRVGDAVRFNVVPSVEPISEEGEKVVAEIRALGLADGAAIEEVVVGGDSAALIDSKAAIFTRVPLAAAIIVVATFALLFLMFGSVLVPLKAIVLNMLSLTAMFGMMVWVFQEGNGADLLGFTATGLTDTSMPILMFCIAFGLSMDYEVFLLSRIKEEYDRTGDNDLAVVVGLERTGRLVTAAALLLSITFIAFATSGVTFLKLFGLGLAVAVLVDAFIVRALLVPALMKIAGDRNWWAPAPLRRLHARFGIAEAVPAEPELEVVGSSGQGSM